MAADNTGTPKGDGFFRAVISFLWDSPEQRGARKARKQAGLSPESGRSTKGRAATAVAAPTRVSRRARLLGGNRGKATILMAVLIVSALLSGIALGVALSKPSRADVRDAVAAELREQGQDFPRGQAVAWADQAAIDWATWDQADPEERSIRMAQYLTSGMDPQAGWNGKGKQTVTFTSVNPDPIVTDANHALVDVDYRLDDNSRRCVSIPVYAYRPEGLTGNSAQWAFALSANPIPRPCAPRTGATADEGRPAGNDELQAHEELSSELTTSFFPGFFSAWAASDTSALRQYTASGVTTIGLGGAMSSTPAPTISDAKLYTPRDGEPVEGTVYHAIVPVTWTVAGSSAQVEAVYDVPMKKVGDRWYVAGEPTAATSIDAAETGAPAARIIPEEQKPASGASDGGTS